MQGFNMGRYYAPDESNPPKFNAGSSSTKQAKKGSQTVRFELPFSICCHTCDPESVLVQGVRFNAEKTKAGYFYSSPIWSFKFKHIACGGEIEIQTDPENSEYVVAEGARRQYPVRHDEDQDQDGAAAGQISAEERERRLKDGFAALEGRVKDMEQAKADNQRIIELYSAQDRDWNDAYTANQRARRQFRTERKVREAKQVDQKRIQSKIGWEGEILDLTQEDELRASLVKFGDSNSADDDIKKATSKPFNLSGVKTKKYDEESSQQRHVRKLVRLSIDPFLAPESFTKSGADPILAGIKRKRNIPHETRTLERSSLNDESCELDQTSPVQKEKPVQDVKGVVALPGLGRYQSDED